MTYTSPGISLLLTKTFVTEKAQRSLFLEENFFKSYIDFGFKITTL